MFSIRKGDWIVATLPVLFSVTLLAGCAKELPPRSALQLMEDPAVLQGVIHRCNDLQSAALNDRECRNAREAVSRLEAQQPPQTEVTEREFEKAREARRARDELERRRREANEKVDPYTMPLAPDMAAPAPTAQSTAVISTASIPSG